MGIFYTAPQTILPAIKDEIRNALMQQPPADPNAADQTAKARAFTVAQATAPSFNAWGVVAAIVIAVLLLGGSNLDRQGSARYFQGLDDFVFVFRWDRSRLAWW